MGLVYKGGAFLRWAHYKDCIPETLKTSLSYLSITWLGHILRLAQPHTSKVWNRHNPRNLFPMLDSEYPNSLPPTVSLQLRDVPFLIVLGCNTLDACYD